MSDVRYVERGGEQVFQPPDLARDVWFYAFVLRADPQAIQKNMCDRYFNIPAGWENRFRAAGPFVLLVFVRINALSSEAQSEPKKGLFEEDEAAIWVMMQDTVRDRVMWFHPYMLVTNTYEMTTGREVFGFHKSIGWMEMPDGPQNADRFTASAIALKQFDPKAKAAKRQLLTVQRVQAAQAAGSPTTWTALEETIAGLAEELGGLLVNEPSLLDAAELVFHEAEDLFRLHGPSVPVLLLKQFRDAAQPETACFQAIVEVRTDTQSFYDAGLLSGDYELLIDDCDSHPIRRELGLGPGPIRPLLGFWLNYDFLLNDGVEIWRASQGAPSWSEPGKKGKWLSWVEGCPLLRRLLS